MTTNNFLKNIGDMLKPKKSPDDGRYIHPDGAPYNSKGIWRTLQSPNVMAMATGAGINCTPIYAAEAPLWAKALATPVVLAPYAMWFFLHLKATNNTNTKNLKIDTQGQRIWGPTNARDYTERLYKNLIAIEGGAALAGLAATLIVNAPPILILAAGTSLYINMKRRSKINNRKWVASNDTPLIVERPKDFTPPSKTIKPKGPWE